MRAYVRTRSLTDFGRIQLIWQNLAEVDQAGRIRQNLVKASEFVCRVSPRHSYCNWASPVTCGQGHLVALGQILSRFEY